MSTHEGREVVEFGDVQTLRTWLGSREEDHPGVWVRLRKSRSTVPSVTSHDLLVGGIAHGWSESTRHAYDADSYLQRFGPAVRAERPQSATAGSRSSWRPRDA